MNQCLDLAKKALAGGNPPVGSLIVFGGVIIGSGAESGKSTGDITNHAEIIAIRDAIKNGYADKLSVAAMYSTHEPCIMCSYMIRHHRIAEIIYGSAVPHIGGSTSQFNILATEDVPKWGTRPKVVGGICTDECNALTTQFLESLSKS